MNKYINQDITSSPLIELIKKGLSPEDIYDTIIYALAPYFQNKHILKKYSKTDLIPKFLGLCKNHYTNIENNISELINFYNKAKTSNKLFYLFCDYIENENKIYDNYWSIYNFENATHENSNKYDYVFNRFRLIEDSLESFLKPLLNLLNKIQTINKLNTKENLDFGKLIKSLDNETFFTELKKLNNTPVPIHQWRNIACHKSFELNENSIICKYGFKNEHVYIIDNYTEISDIARNLYQITITIKLSLDFFILDNIEEIKKIKKFSPKIDNRPEPLESDLALTLLPQGFLIDNIKIDSNSVLVEISDLTNGDLKKRAIHSSQFIYTIWLYIKKEHITVLYKNKQKEPILKSSSNSTVCTQIHKQEKPFSYLAEKINFEILKEQIK